MGSQRVGHDWAAFTEEQTQWWRSLKWKESATSTRIHWGRPLDLVTHRLRLMRMAWTQSPARPQQSDLIPTESRWHHSCQDVAYSQEFSHAKQSIPGLGGGTDRHHEPAVARSMSGGEGSTVSDHRAQLPHRVTASRSRNRTPELKTEGGAQAWLQASLGVVPAWRRGAEPVARLTTWRLRQRTLEKGGGSQTSPVSQEER